MTKEELIEMGFVPQQCKIGTLYFNKGLFCLLKTNGSVDIRSTANDMKSLGIANTKLDIIKIARGEVQSSITYHEDKIRELKELLKGYDEYIENYTE